MSSSSRTKTGSASPPECGGSSSLKRSPRGSRLTKGVPVRLLGVVAVLLALEGCATVQATVHRLGVAIGAIRTAPQTASDVLPQSTDIPVPLARRQPPPQEPPPDPSDKGSAMEARKDPRDIRRVSAGSTPSTLGATEVGYYMDVLQGRLTQEVGKEAYIERLGDNIIVLLPVSFDIDSAQINSSGRDVLRHLAAVLTEYRLTIVAVQVRGPDVDANGQNPRLESDRVTALSRYLTDAGVSGKRIENGEARALQSGASATAGAGVHIELQLSPIGGAL